MQRAIFASAVVLAAGLAAQAATVVVFSNNAMPGDSFTFNPGTSNPATPGAALGTSGWFYTNVRNAGVVGVNTNNPRSGNGSAFMSIPAGNTKADIEYFSTNAQGQLTSMGTLGNLSSLKFDWYRDGSSTVLSHFVPALRIYVDADGDLGTTTDRGYLIYERVYNTAGAAPVDQWVTDDVFNYNGAGASANLWLRQFGPPGATNEVYNRDLQEWIAGQSTAGFLSFSPNSVVYGLSSGIGSGWTNSFVGAVDNITIGFGGNETVFNFEVVPTPGAAGLLGLGGLVAARRRRA